MISSDDLIPISEIQGDSIEDTELLRQMGEDAKVYVTSFVWCPPIKQTYFAFGVGGVIGLFLVEFDRPIDGRDKCLWVIVGDLPSAYVVMDLEKPSDVIEAYCSLMEDWANAVTNKKPMNDVFPVRAEASEENAASLRRRVNFVREQILVEMVEGETGRKTPQ